MQGFDSHGGSEDRRFEATGYSRFDQAEDRWWTVDPDGGALVTVGLNHADEPNDEPNLKYPHSAALVRLRREQGRGWGIKALRDGPYRGFTDPVEEFSKSVYERI